MRIACNLDAFVGGELVDFLFKNHIVVDPDDIAFDHGREVYHYWELKRRDRPQPCWNELDLMDIYRVAPYMTVKDALDDGDDFCNRYFGSGLAAVLGYDGTGKKLTDNYSDEALSLIMDVCQTAFRSQQIVQSNGRVTWASDKDFLNYSCLYLPIDRDPGVPGHLLSVFDFNVF